MDTSPDDANGNRQTHTELSYEEWRNQMIAKAKQIIATAKTQQHNQMDWSWLFLSTYTINILREIQTGNITNADIFLAILLFNLTQN